MRWTGTKVPSRRAFLAGAAAVNLAPGLGWADAGNPRFLAAARMPDGSYHLFGLRADAEVTFSIPLSARGHAAAGHPTRPIAVAFARRPGTFALVLDCVNGSVLAQLTAPTGRHFYGHGVFNRDGSRLYTTENAFELGEGRIGIWAANEDYRRIGEFHSGGIGPHEVVRLPGTDILAVANGGIDTHPDTGRTKLNLPTMQSNLTYLTTDGEVLEQIQLEPELRLNSIRHLSVRQDGTIGFACQWQQDHFDGLPLQGTHRMGEAPEMLALPTEYRAIYAGSIAFNQSGAKLAVTFPRSNGYAIWQVARETSGTWADLHDACGVGGLDDDFVITSGTGAVLSTHRGAQLAAGLPRSVAWDNHLVAV